MKRITAALFALFLTATGINNISATAMEERATDISLEHSLGLSSTILEEGYMITIPSKMDLSGDGAMGLLMISFAGAEQLNGSILRVTLEGTSAPDGSLSLQSTEGGMDMDYQIITASGETISQSSTVETLRGAQLASFTRNGSQSLTVIPQPREGNEPGLYTGSIIYSITIEEP